MQHIKLQLEVKLKSDMIIGGNRALEAYHLFITFLDKDESFESDFRGNRSIVYTCENGFKIRTIWDEPFGAINDDGLMIPQLDKVGFELKKTFPTDNERYQFVKNLRIGLQEWADNWKGFKYDGESTFKMVGNLWTISCERRVKDRRLYQDHTHDNSLTRNIFF